MISLRNSPGVTTSNSTIGSSNVARLLVAPSLIASMPALRKAISDESTWW